MCVTGRGGADVTQRACQAVDSFFFFFSPPIRLIRGMSSMLLEAKASISGSHLPLPHPPGWHQRRNSPRQSSDRRVGGWVGWWWCVCGGGVVCLSTTGGGGGLWEWCGRGPTRWLTSASQLVGAKKYMCILPPHPPPPPTALLFIGANCL